MVTGGAGYIGSCVVKELLRRGDNPIVLDSLYWGDDALKQVLNEITLIRGDCRNSRDVLKALDNADAVLHLAGIVGEAACLKNEKAHFSINVESTRTLINCCTDPDVNLIRDFIFSSSCSVYGNVSGIYSEVDENTPPSPLSAYAYAKLRSEEIILDRGKEIPHFHPSILRLSTVFGWSNRPRLDLVTNNFAYRAWRDKEIHIFGDGHQYRSLVHVRDAARAFVDILKSPRYLRNNKVFHVGDKKNNMTVSEIAELVKSILPGVKIIYHKDKKSDRRDYSINCKKIQNTIGWKTDVSVEDGIKELINNFNSHNWDWNSDKFRNSSFKYD